MTTANDFLMATGGAGAKFENIGDTITGTIVSAEIRQQTDIKDGKPLTWDDNSPRMQMLVTLATDLRENPDDNGHRTLYVKGSTKAGSKSLHDAVRAAVIDSGTKGLEPGGRLQVSYVGTEPSTTRGFNDRKLYQATYTGPDHAAATGDYLGTAPAPVQQQPTPAPVQPAPAAVAPAVPAATPPTTAAPTGQDMAEKARQLIALSIDDATIHTATGLDLGVIAQLRNAA